MFESAKQLQARKRKNTFRCVQDIVVQNEIQLWNHRIENGKISAFLALNSLPQKVEIDLLCICQIFLSALLHLSEMK